MPKKPWLRQWQRRKDGNRRYKIETLFAELRAKLAADVVEKAADQRRQRKLGLTHKNKRSIASRNRPTKRKSVK
jgi:hypothetical protein